MKIGIYVHSHTGNTLQVAQKLLDRLLADGREAVLERVEAVSKDTGVHGEVPLASCPDTASADALVFAAPVWAFSLNPVMKTYLAQLPPLQGKPVCCMVTHQFAWPWLGGNRAVRQMQNLLTQKGARVLATGVINWSGKAREAQMDTVTNTLKTALVKEL